MWKRYKTKNALFWKIFARQFWSKVCCNGGATGDHRSSWQRVVAYEPVKDFLCLKNVLRSFIWDLYAVWVKNHFVGGGKILFLSGTKIDLPLMYAQPQFRVKLIFKVLFLYSRNLLLIMKHMQKFNVKESMWITDNEDITKIRTVH